MSRYDYLIRGVYRAEGVALMAESHELRRALEELVELVKPKLAPLVDVDVLDGRPLLSGQDLPRDDVRVVLDDREDDQVAFSDVLATPRIGDKVDRLGRASRVNDLFR